MPSRDPHEVLGVAQDATADDIRRAWRALCAIHHPDLNVDASVEVRTEAARRMAEVNESYQRLTRSPGATAPAVGRGTDPAAGASSPTRDGRGAAQRSPERSRIEWIITCVVAASLASIAGYALVRGGEAPTVTRVEPLSPMPMRDERAATFTTPTCPPAGQVVWITETIAVESSTSADGGAVPVFEVAASGRVDNRTARDVDVDPLLDLYDVREHRSAVGLVVRFVDRSGTELDPPARLASGDSATWVLATRVELQPIDGATGGPPVRAAANPTGLRTGEGAACSFSATSVSVRAD